MVSIVRQSCVVCGWPSIIMMLFIPHKRIVGEKQLGQIRVTVILCIDFKRFSSKQQIKVVLSDRLRRPNTKLAGLGETSSVPVFLRGRKPSSFKLFSSIQPLRMTTIQQIKHKTRFHLNKNVQVCFCTSFLGKKFLRLKTV